MQKIDGISTFQVILYKFNLMPLKVAFIWNFILAGGLLHIIPWPGAE